MRADSLCLVSPRVDRMPNLLIVGETNNGKTMIARRFERQHPAADNPKGDHALVPVLLVQAPPTPDESRFYGVILEALRAPYNPRATVEEKQWQVQRLLRSFDLSKAAANPVRSERARDFLILAGRLAKVIDAPAARVF
jgi:hypothetical protein